jgi:anthranilate phosphoribosyltransferase
LTDHISGARHLTEEQVESAVSHLVDESVSASEKAQFLCSLALKGETVDEIAWFALALRRRAVQPPIDAATRAGTVLDVCGTGGDRLNTFNISTTVAIVCAAAGIAVAKHGNRAITSQAGSADVLEALGIKINRPPADAARCLAEQKFAFFFAPDYHPAFKNISAARRLCADRGQRTIFNFLGPLLNPATPNAQLVGVPRPDLCEPLAKVLQMLGVHRGMVVSGQAGEGAAGSKSSFLDEISILAETTVCEFYQERGLSSSNLEIANFPLQRALLADLAGGDKEQNAGIVREILNGRERGPKRDAVLLNSAAALFVADAVKSLSAGWDKAVELIDSGRAVEKLSQLQK